MEHLYDVKWERILYPGEQECHSLTARVAFARLIRCIENSGPIKVISIEKSPKNSLTSL